MNNSDGALILGDEGATFWIPKDELQAYRLDEATASAARSQVEPNAADDEVVGFAMPTMVTRLGDIEEEEEELQMFVPTVASSAVFRPMPTFYGNFGHPGRR